MILASIYPIYPYPPYQIATVVHSADGNGLQEQSSRGVVDLQHDVSNNSKLGETNYASLLLKKDASSGLQFQTKVVGLT